MTGHFISAGHRFVSTGQQRRLVRSAVRLIEVQRGYFGFGAAWAIGQFPQNRRPAELSWQIPESGRRLLAPGNTVATYTNAIVSLFSGHRARLPAVSYFKAHSTPAQ
jgi:hypothetical protein